MRARCWELTGRGHELLPAMKLKEWSCEIVETISIYRGKPFRYRCLSPSEVKCKVEAFRNL
jgi:hypothetical protein